MRSCKIKLISPSHNFGKVSNVMSITKNQHYVPQFLLKKFKISPSRDNKVQIRLFDKHSQTTEVKSIKHVFAEDYFYDKDNLVENQLGVVETQAANHINKIINGDFSVLKTATDALLQFISSQYSRTEQVRNQIHKMINDVQMHLVKSTFEVNKDISPFKKGFESENIDYGNFDYTEDDFRSISAMNAVNGLILFEMLKDLSFHLLENNTEDEFIIGDQPVVLCNWLLSSYIFTKNIPVNSSPIALGAQLFMPLSPKLYICLYDPKVYKYGSKSEIKTEINKESVEWLNKLQLIHSANCIGFSDSKMQQKIYVLNQLCKNTNLVQYINRNTLQYTMQGNVLKNLEPKPNFFKILDKAKNLPNLAISDNPHSDGKLVTAGLLYRTTFSDMKV